MAAIDWLTNIDLWISLSTLTLLEIVLGIDNIIFIAILAGKLPAARQASARRIGLGLALITRVLLLLSLAWIVRLTAPLVTLFGHELSGRDLILIIGGLFLLAKSMHEIREKLGNQDAHRAGQAAASFIGVLAQIMLLDVVFSLDSVITAVGMVDRVGVMIAAIVIAVGIMMAASGPISAFVDAHPTVKMLALSFLLLIGASLLLEGIDRHIPKSYIYVAMGFAVFVEILNLRLRRGGRASTHTPMSEA
jgi:predicted tellurium resistance membrane protein TerC